MYEREAAGVVVSFWIDEKTYPIDEIGSRFHHRLVWIHPFPNGNGRHARLAADLLTVQLGGKPFTWGRGNLASAGSVRTDYIDALRAADVHDYAALITFVHS